MRYLLMACSMMVISPAFGQTVERFHDRNGNFQGSISHEGNRDIERDKNGNELGWYAREGDRLVHYDRNGNMLGYSKAR